MYPGNYNRISHVPARKKKTGLCDMNPIGFHVFVVLCEKSRDSKKMFDEVRSSCFLMK